MFAFALLTIAGMLAGFLLLQTAPVLRSSPLSNLAKPAVSVIIPARNEASNLPKLLQSLCMSSPVPSQIIVVDDHSTDATAAIASSRGATVISSATLPVGWTGKTWACHQGALAATCDTFFFLDADTYFVGEGYPRIVAALPQNAALSILPLHRTRHWYEQLSLFFNIIVAMGAGGFGRLVPPLLFGPSLLIRRDLYFRVGGHESVKGDVLENLNLAAKISKAGGTVHTLAGRGVLETRMFPHGLAQLRESWVKAFATGAGTVPPLALALSILWLGAPVVAVVALVTHPGLASLALYLLNAAQIAWYGRQLGTFRLLAFLLYPIPLVFYFATFAQSLLLRMRGQPIHWRGRRL